MRTRVDQCDAIENDYSTRCPRVFQFEMPEEVGLPMGTHLTGGIVVAVGACGRG